MKRGVNFRDISPQQLHLLPSTRPLDAGLFTSSLSIHVEKHPFIYNILNKVTLSTLDCGTTESSCLHQATTHSKVQHSGSKWPQNTMGSLLRIRSVQRFSKNFLMLWPAQPTSEVSWLNFSQLSKTKLTSMKKVSRFWYLKKNKKTYIDHFLNNISFSDFCYSVTFKPWRISAVKNRTNDRKLTGCSQASHVWWSSPLVSWWPSCSQGRT